MERFKFDVIMAMQALAVAEVVQQLPLGQPMATLADDWRRGGYTLYVGPDTVGTGVLSVTFHFVLLTLKRMQASTFASQLVRRVDPWPSEKLPGYSVLALRSSSIGTPASKRETRQG